MAGYKNVQIGSKTLLYPLQLNSLFTDISVVFWLKIKQIWQYSLFSLFMYRESPPCKNLTAILPLQLLYHNPKKIVFWHLYQNCKKICKISKKSEKKSIKKYPKKIFQTAYYNFKRRRSKVTGEKVKRPEKNNWKSEIDLEAYNEKER